MSNDALARTTIAGGGLEMVITVWNAS